MPASAYHLCRLTRLHAAGAAAFVYPLGPVIATAGRARPPTLLLISAIGVLSHTYGCTVNDIADLGSDLRNPARSRSVLVRRDLSVAAARTAAWAQLAAACGLAAVTAAVADGGWAFPIAIGALFASITVSNAFQKRGLAHPLAMDALFGLNMGTPAALCCLLFASPDPRPVALASAVFAVQMVLLNAVAGNLKDLEHDRLVGDDTTALRLGVRLTEDRRAMVPWRHRLLVAVLLMGSALGSEVLVYAAPVSPAVRALLSIAVAALHVLAWRSLASLLRGRRPVSATGREPYLGLNFVALMLACTPWAPVAVLVIAALAVAWLPLTRILLLRRPPTHVGEPHGSSH